MKKANNEFIAMAAAAIIAFAAVPAVAFSGSALLYLSPSSTVNVGNLGGDQLSIFGITGAGDIAWGVSNTSNNGDNHVFVWDGTSLQDIGLLGGAAEAYMNDNGRNASADGSVIVGYSDSGITHAFRWTASDGVVHDLGTLSGGTYSTASAVSADGTTVVGVADDSSGDDHAFRWTESGGTMDDLGTLGGVRSEARFVSSDGTVVVGRSETSVMGETHTFRWTETSNMMTDIGTLGGSNTDARAMSDDGSVIVGRSSTASGFEHAFVWDGSMNDLGTFGGNNSEAIALSSDGSIVVGSAQNAGGNSHAFRWDGTTMEDLGLLAGGLGSYTQALAVSADGSVVVGRGDVADHHDPHAWRWTEALGIEDLNDVAASAGIDLNGFTLYEAYGVSNDGQTIIGGAYSDDDAVDYILKLSGGAGLITVDELLQSLAPSRVVAQQGSESVQQGIGYSMFTAKRALDAFAGAPRVASAGMTGMAAGAPYTPAARMSAYATGTFGIGQNGDSDNSAVNGSAGMLFRVSDNIVMGGGVIGGGSRVKTHLGGHSTLDSVGGSLIGSYETGDTGLRIYGVAAAAYLDISTTRHYMNGSSVDGSRGDTHGFGYGGALHAGWAMPVWSKTTLEPYGELEYSKVSMDGYAEQGGAFAATYSDHDMHRLVSRLGGELKRKFSDTVTMGVRAAWGHRLDGDGGAFSATAAGFTLPMSGNVGDRDWAEGGISGRFKLNEKTTLAAEVTARTGNTEEAQAEMTLGLNYAF